MSAESSKPLLIAGTGALACLFAARLSAAGTPIYMMGSWAEGLEALRRSGVRLVDAQGGESAYAVDIIDTNQAVSSQDPLVDYALVLVKSWQTSRVAGQLSQRLSPHGLVITLQNGLGNRERLAEVLDAKRVALGVTTVGARLLAPGQVRQAGSARYLTGYNARIG